MDESIEIDEVLMEQPVAIEPLEQDGARSLDVELRDQCAMNAIAVPIGSERGHRRCQEIRIPEIVAVEIRHERAARQPERAIARRRLPGKFLGGVTDAPVAKEGG